jgi:hypothetical protein
MQGTPQTMQNNPTYDDLLDDVYCFLAQRVEKAQSFGINNIMVDVGIGFGKTLQDNIMLIRNLEHFVTLGKPLLVGASRKSMIKFKPKKFKVGDTIKVDFIVIHPMDTGTKKDKTRHNHGFYEWTRTLWPIKRLLHVYDRNGRNVRSDLYYGSS